MSNYKEGQINQLANALEGRGFTAEHITKLGQYPRLDDLRLVLDNQAEIVIKPKPKPVPAPLLEFISMVRIPATASKFVAKDRFVVNTGPDAPVKISYLGDNFTAWFLSGEGKTEDPIGKQVILSHKLLRSAHDVLLPGDEQAIIPELGCEERAETTLTEMFYLMEKQKDGEVGVLLNNGWANIFYIKDHAGVLRAVRVRW
ncbi:MAG: hypothetical protein WCT25_03545, partial [Candidatus Paceibacterota bacterium]